jgi:hypothetical protein
MQELTAINVQMRIITAENIDQLSQTSNTKLSDILKNAQNIEVPNELSIKSKENKSKLDKLVKRLDGIEDRQKEIQESIKPKN